MEDVSDKIVEKIKKIVVNTFFFENLVFYNVEKFCISGRPQMAIQYGACALHTG